jgi:hypothetical protein
VEQFCCLFHKTPGQKHQQAVAKGDEEGSIELWKAKVPLAHRNKKFPWFLCNGLALFFPLTGNVWMQRLYIKSELSHQFFLYQMRRLMLLMSSM